MRLHVVFITNSHMIVEIYVLFLECSYNIGYVYYRIYLFQCCKYYFFQVKSNGPKLVPFFKTVAVFFVLFGEDSYLNSIFYCIIKCLPIVSLMFFVLLHGMNFTEAYAYSRKILLGLVFSAIGDAFLVWKGQYFIHGLCAFAVAQLCYVWAFGVRPVKPITGAAITAVAAMIYMFVLPGLKGVMVYFGLLYVVVIGMMGWRAIARFQKYEDWPWTSLSGMLGAISFMISDCVIAVNKFRFEVPYSHNIIMSTYYFAQMCIALSVVDSQADAIIEISRNDSKKKNELNGYTNGHAIKAE